MGFESGWGPERGWARESAPPEIRAGNETGWPTGEGRTEIGAVDVAGAGDGEGKDPGRSPICSATARALWGRFSDSFDKHAIKVAATGAGIGFSIRS